MVLEGKNLTNIFVYLTNNQVQFVFKHQISNLLVTTELLKEKKFISHNAHIELSINKFFVAKNNAKDLSTRLIKKIEGLQ